jgi:hypothetical protein
MASDGKWYPPQSAAPPPPPPPGAYQQAVPVAPAPVVKKSNKGCLVAVLLVFGLLVLIVVGSIAAIAYFGNKASDKLEAIGSSLDSPAVDPSDPGGRADDRYVKIGDSVELSGYTTKVEKAGYQQRLGDIIEEGYLYASVDVLNRDDASQSVSIFDWKLQTPSGELLDPYSTNNEEQLQDNMLVEGGRAQGKVIFLIGDRTGDFFLIYKPDPLTKTRGIWKVTIEG